MKEEILRLRGRISNAEFELAELEVKAAADIASIRSLADPYEEDLSKIKSPMILAEAKSLNETVQQIKKLTAKLKEYKEALE